MAHYSPFLIQDFLIEDGTAQPFIYNSQSATLDNFVWSNLKLNNYVATQLCNTKEKH